MADNENATATAVQADGEQSPETQPERRSTPAEPVRTAAVESHRDPSEWRDCKTGREVRVLAPMDTFADQYRNEEPLSLGRAVRALIVGDWSDAPAEQRALSSVSWPGAFSSNPRTAPPGSQPHDPH